MSCEGGKDEYSDEDIGLSIEYCGINQDLMLRAHDFGWFLPFGKQSGLGTSKPNIAKLLEEFDWKYSVGKGVRCFMTHNIDDVSLRFDLETVH